MVTIYPRLFTYAVEGVGSLLYSVLTRDEPEDLKGNHVNRGQRVSTVSNKPLHGKYLSERQGQRKEV